MINIESKRSEKTEKLYQMGYEFVVDASRQVLNRS
jgi:hypothetical protein